MRQTLSARSRRRLRAIRRSLFLECMERRDMLNAAPIAVADAYDVAEDNVLDIGTASNTTAGLVHHWKFDETTGNTATDAVGGNDGTLVNWGGAELKWVDGRLGGALDFGDTNNYVITEELTAYDRFTFSFWLRLNVREGVNPHIISPSGDDWIVQNNEEERGIGFYYDHGETDAQASHEPVVGEWEHYVVTFDHANSFSRIYRDGVEVGAGAVSKSEPRTAWIMGHNQQARNGDDSWNGLIDEMRIYNRLLNSEEITTLAEGQEIAPVNGVLQNDTDPDGDELLAVLVTDVSHGSLELNQDGTFSYTPQQDYNGVDTFSYLALDGPGLSEPVTVTITVASVNDAPLAEDDDFAMNLGETLEVSAASGVLVNDQDVDGAEMQVELVEDVSAGTLILKPDGSFEYQPRDGFFGSDQFRYRVTDDLGDSSEATATILVRPHGDRPFALDDHFEIDEDETLVLDAAPFFSLTRIRQDTASIVYAPQKDVLYVTTPSSAKIRRNSLLVIDPYTGDVLERIPIDRDPGRLVISDDGQVIHMETDDRHAVQPFYVEDHTLGTKFWMPDVGGEYSRSVLDMDPIPGRPNAVMIARRYDGFSPLGGGVAIYENGVALPKSLWGPLGNGGATVLAINEAGDRLYGYNNASTAYDFWVMEILEDGIRQLEHHPWGSILEHNVWHTTIAGNRLFAKGGRIIDLETLTDVGTFQATDATFFASSQDNRLFTVTDDNRSHTMRSYDLDTLSLSAAIDLQNIPGNTDDLRRFGDNGLAFHTYEGELVLVQSDELFGITARGVLRNDLNVEQDNLATTLVEDVSHGELTLNGDGTFEYTPDTDFSGTDSFTYRFANGELTSNVATVTITVHPVNDLPQAVDDAYSVALGGQLVVDAGSGLLANDSDLESPDSLTASLVDQPAHGDLTLNDDGSFTYEPAESFELTDQFTYRVSDGLGFSTTATVLLSLDAPQIVVGDHVLLPNLTDQRIDIFVTGGHSVSGLDLFLQIGDGGPELATLGLNPGTDGPGITAIDLKTETIFQEIPDLALNLGSLPQVANWSIALTDGGDVEADGVLLSVTIDTTGFFEGQWDMNLVDVLPQHQFGPFRTAFADKFARITNGSITVVPAEVVQRSIFYNESEWDGQTPGADPADDRAIATDKVPLFAGESASFANYTSYDKGINGIIVDLAGLRDPTGLTVDDFEFRVGRNNDPSTWQPAAKPSLDIQAGRGVGGTDRMSLIWENNAIEQNWLEVTVKSNASTLLSHDDVFYFGNAIGESGNAPNETLVTSVDVIAARDHQRGPFDLATIDNEYDFNRDRLVSSIDVILARDNQVGLLAALPLITPIGSPAAIPAMAVPEGELCRHMGPNMAGDANLDGGFDSTDLVEVFRAGEYEDDVPGNSSWSEGDWNCDAEFTTEDLLFAFQHGAYRDNSAASVAAEDVADLRLLPATTRLATPPSVKPSESGVANPPTPWPRTTDLSRTTDTVALPAHDLVFDLNDAKRESIVQDGAIQDAVFAELDLTILRAD